MCVCEYAAFDAGGLQQYLIPAGDVVVLVIAFVFAPFSLLRLRAKNNTEANVWVEAIRQRMEYYETHKYR